MARFEARGVRGARRGRWPGSCWRREATPGYWMRPGECEMARRLADLHHDRKESPTRSLAESEDEPNPIFTDCEAGGCAQLAVVIGAGSRNARLAGPAVRTRHHGTTSS